MREITLPPPAPSEGAALGKGGKDQPYQVGFGRPVPGDQQQVALSSLSWSEAPGGGRRATVSVRSSGAKSVRVGIRLADAPEGLKLTFAGPNGPISVVDGGAVASQSSGDPYWSPVVEGDTATIELSAPSTPAAGAVLHILTVSHIP
jgi:hypothetical protein